MDEVMREIPISEGKEIIIEGDMNGHAGKDSIDYDKMYGEHGFEERYEA